MSDFVRVSADEWRINDAAGLSCRLQSGPDYDDIVRAIAQTATVLHHRREGRKNVPGQSRAVVTFVVDKALINLFHNASTGYRAQYYVSPTLGDAANELMVRSLGARAVANIADRSKRTCPLEWLKLSLGDPSAKVWIHQGLWLRQARLTDERLCVQRWHKQRHHENAKVRRRARWAALLPDAECVLEVKGGFLSEQGTPVGSLKSERAREIHEYGFT